MSTMIHMSLDVAGYLQGKRNYGRMFRHSDGRWMTPSEAKQNLLECLAQGKRFLPVGTCDNFDYETGCLGHEDTDKP